MDQVSHILIDMAGAALDLTSLFESALELLDVVAGGAGGLLVWDATIQSRFHATLATSLAWMLRSFVFAIPHIASKFIERAVGRLQTTVKVIKVEMLENFMYYTLALVYVLPVLDEMFIAYDWMQCVEQVAMMCLK